MPRLKTPVRKPPLRKGAEKSTLQGAPRTNRLCKKNILREGAKATSIFREMPGHSRVHAAQEPTGVPKVPPEVTRLIRISTLLIYPVAGWKDKSRILN